MKKLIFIVLISLTKISLLQAKVNKNIFLSYSEYQNLSLKTKNYYFKGIQKEFFEFEKRSSTEATFVFNDLYKNPLSTLFFPLAFADDAAAAAEMCIIGGQSVPRIQNKCSTRKNPCKDADTEKYPDGSFQCGEIFNSACVARTPIKSLSARCFEASQNSETPPAAAEYEKITSRANELYQKVCGLESAHPDSIGCKKLSKKIDELNIKAKSMNSDPKDSKEPASKDDKATASSENNKDCLQIVSLTLEGSEQIQDNHPIRENDLHQEATGFVNSLNRFAHSTNYWMEPTDQPAKPNCQTSNKDQLVSKTSSDYIKDVIDQIKKYSATQDSCNDSNLQDKIKNYFLNASSTQKKETGLVYKNSSTRLLPNDSEQLCTPNIADSSFIRIPSSQSSSLSELAEPFLKKVQDLAKKCTQNKPNIQMSVFANSGNTKQDECSIRFMNRNISPEEFYKSIYKPVRQSNLPITLNLNQYSTCFQEKIVSLEAEEKNQNSLTSPSCILVLSSPDEPGHGINELFGPSPTIKYEQFLGKLQNPLTARICAMATTALDNPKNSLSEDYKKIVDDLSQKVNFPGKASLFKTCETTYEKIKNESSKINHAEQPYLNVKEKKLALDCLKKINQKKSSENADANIQTIFGLLPRIEQFSSAQKPYSYLQLQTISQNIPNNCNQDLSIYKKNTYVIKSPPTEQPSPSNPPTQIENKQ